jgi:hypothetical protein
MPRGIGWHGVARPQSVPPPRPDDTGTALSFYAETHCRAVEGMALNPCHAVFLTRRCTQWQ